jgi:hypothetical protein
MSPKSQHMPILEANVAERHLWTVNGSKSDDRIVPHASHTY